MDAERLEQLMELEQLRQKTGAAAAELLDRHGATIEAYRAQISAGFTDAFAQLRHNVHEISLGNTVCEQLVAQSAEYVSWLQWSLWDLPYFAVALQPPAEHFRAAVSACGLAYLSLRIFDDVIDRHFWYKGKHPSLLAATSETVPSSQGAEGLTILAGLLLCLEGLAKLSDPAHADLAHMLQPVIRSLRAAVIGAIMEQSEPEEHDRTYYDRLVQLKNVEYAAALYAALDPDRASPLYPFLERYYTLAQHLNDVQDFAEDQARGQPNLLSLYLPLHDGATSHFESPHWHAAPAAEHFLANTFLELGKQAECLPSPERLIAQLKLGESLEAALGIGLFASAKQAPAVAYSSRESNIARVGLRWYANLPDVIERVGNEALVSVDCAVCGSADRHYLFRKQGFAFHRCRACSHIYVSPRINAELQAQMAQELDSQDIESTYLEVQKLYATAICQLLRTRAPGNRLLDIGFGRGYLMDLARAFHFEVFGVDSSMMLVHELQPRFGKHLHHMILGQEEIPWRSFDVVVMSHILEHLPDPATSLQQIRAIMNPGALLYVAVPDMRSLPFTIFGQKWDVISPLVHFQYFNEDSLSHLLRHCGFLDIERIQAPQVFSRSASRWIRLMTRLQGTESSEVAILARLPRDD